jgi:hypothetical protein
MYQAHGFFMYLPLFWDHMKTNIGGIDRFLRIVVGVAALMCIPYCDSPYRWFGLLGAVFVATGMIGYCHAYTIFGCSTCKTDGGAHH